MESIRPIGGGELDRLKPLWLALQDHHVRISPRLADLPKRLPEESWSPAREIRSLAREPGHLRPGLRAGRRPAGSPLGRGTPRGTAAINSQNLRRIAPTVRGQGVGSRLLAAVRARLASDGIARLAVTSAVTNVGSHRFYERHGLNKAHIVFLGPTKPGEPA